MAKASDVTTTWRTSPMTNLFGEDDTADSGAYRVLARKYRPTVFEDLIGQDVLVRTLSNAIKTGRLAHAFLLTGIRGVGKTTTARLIARALNCIGEDGQGGPTIQPCGTCANCVMIAEDRHMDVIEMDAASRTGVNDIRELIETVHYAPTNARYKIYIIDEVHMLSTSAFNALLKTLEEPPPHVKFIFATTELHKIPVTILSRCQTFELKRVDGEELAGHLKKICEREQVDATDDALKLIANAAEGSVRDSLSLLDQAIAHGTDDDGKPSVNAELVRGMLGMADRSRSFSLLDEVLAGEVKAALHSYQQQYNDGAEPTHLLQELMELLHLVTRIKLVPDLADSPEFAEAEREYARTLSGKMEVGHLTRAWQIMAKGLQEARMAPNPFMAVEMVLIRLMHAANLPSPAELARQLEKGDVKAAAKPAQPASTTGNSMPQGNGTAAARSLQPDEVADSQPEPTAQLDQGDNLNGNNPTSFREAVALFEQHKELVLWSHLNQSVRLVAFEPGRIELNTNPTVPGDFAGKVGRFLSDWTGNRWMVAISNHEGEASLKEQDDAAKAEHLRQSSEHPLVQSVLAAFEGAKVIDIQTRKPRDDQENDA